MPKSLLGSFLYFLRSPNLLTPPDALSPKAILGRILRLYSLEYVTVSLILFILDLLNAPSGEYIEDIFEISGPSLFFAAVIFAPVVEEIIFRLLLRPFALNISILLSIVVYALSVWMHPAGFILNGVLLLIFNTVISHQYSKKIILQQFYRQRPRLIFYSTVLIFGMVHITNYELESWPLLPLLVFSQTIGALLLGFARVRYGFGWAVLLHTFHNGLVCLPILIYKAFGSIELQKYALTEDSDVAFPVSDILSLDNIVINAVRVYEWGIFIIGLILAWQLIREWIKVDKVKLFRRQ